VLLVALVRSRRRRHGGQQQVLTLVSEMNVRMEGMVRELSEALERAQEEGRRNRFLGELGASIDLDEVLARVLESTMALPGVDAAIVTVGGEGEQRVVSAAGMSLEQAESQVFSSPPDVQAHSMSIT
jgi:hypothetical protein